MKTKIIFYFYQISCIILGAIAWYSNYKYLTYIFIFLFIVNLVRYLYQAYKKNKKKKEKAFRKKMRVHLDILITYYEESLAQIENYCSNYGNIHINLVKSFLEECCISETIAECGMCVFKVDDEIFNCLVEKELFVGTLSNYPGNSKDIETVKSRLRQKILVLKQYRNEF
jgi:hypothetical protein